MYKVGICGHYADGKKILNGQTIKTINLTKELELYLDDKSIKRLDTHNWKKNPLSLFKRCINLAKNSENIIILPAHNGVKLFIPLFVFLKKIYKFKLHYVMIGGWFPTMIETNVFLKILAKKIDNIYVETIKNQHDLKTLGFKNIEILLNFKRLDVQNKDKLKYTIKKPFKLCTFSRVLKGKGIEDAILTVKEINQIEKEIVYTLDIYGPIDVSYRKEFEQLTESFPEYISYKGIINPENSVDILKSYFALLFPTKYYTEGIPGTIIDSFAAGLPIIYSEWENYKDLFGAKDVGLGYEFGNLDQFRDRLLEIKKNPNLVNGMRKNCIEEAEKYNPNNIIPQLIKGFK